MKMNRRMTITMVAGLALFMGGCGQNNSQNNLVKDVQLRTFEQNGASYVEVASLFNTGATQLASFELPIFNPEKPSEVYGRIAVRQVLTGNATGFELGLAVNLTEVAHLNLVDKYLPNGTPIPVGGLGNTPVIGVPVGGSGARIYVAYGPNVALIGAALPIREFDGMTDAPVNVFPMFEFGEGVRGIAGIFTGTEKKQSGIALFVDAGPALNPAPITSKLLAGDGAVRAPAASALKFKSIRAPSDETYQVNYRLYKLNKKRAVLHPSVR
ncbi:MAG: hypothetical protein A2428_05665 [Bdellovibrionales bacterium RIFOXYC1_FULL_54_43]|nr:MAG: hypothetical protein A2428_05665 [Bdellovibrionales bacterium RIFOXYC1_FULL_54_43]OFZ85526.1 MAG: hypothetical protein A2603_17000 [Bdellovibrionales bacterium RIFOXYD1_FULL_55_31]